MICQIRIGSCNECAILLSDVGKREGYTCVRSAIYGKSLSPSLNFAMKLSILKENEALKREIFSYALSSFPPVKHRLWSK